MGCRPHPALTHPLITGKADMYFEIISEMIFLVAVAVLIVVLFSADVLLSKRISRLRRILRQDELLIKNLRKRVWSLEAHIHDTSWCTPQLGCTHPRHPSHQKDRTRDPSAAEGWGELGDDDMLGGSGIELEEYPVDKDEIPAFLRKQTD